MDCSCGSCSPAPLVGAASRAQHPLTGVAWGSFGASVYGADVLDDQQLTLTEVCSAPKTSLSPDSAVASLGRNVCPPTALAQAAQQARDQITDTFVGMCSRCGVPMTPAQVQAGGVPGVAAATGLSPAALLAAIAPNKTSAIKIALAAGLMGSAQNPPALPPATAGEGTAPSRISGRPMLPPPTPAVPPAYAASEQTGRIPNPLRSFSGRSALGSLGDLGAGTPTAVPVVENAWDFTNGVYFVQSGDTLMGLAITYIGPPGTVAQMQQIWDLQPNHFSKTFGALQVGDKLIMPPVAIANAKKMIAVPGATVAANGQTVTPSGTPVTKLAAMGTGTKLALAAGAVVAALGAHKIGVI